MRKKLFLDSGAFTAHRSGRAVELFRYIDFLYTHLQHTTTYAALDVIPPTSGGYHSVEEAALQGWQNYVTMVRCGLDPIPVYHAGERRYWLEKYLGEGCSYIGLGGIARKHATVRESWLSDVFSYLAENAPTTKTHAFGVTSTKLLFDYPFYSADSTSWEIHGGFGRVMFPAPGPGLVPDYSLPPMSIKTSSRESNAGPALKGLGHATRKYLDEQVKKLGTTWEVLAESRKARVRATTHYYIGMSGARRFRRNLYHGQGFFNRRPIDSGEHNPILYLTVTSGASARGVIREGGSHLLVSFEYAGKNWVREVMRESDGN